MSMCKVRKSVHIDNHQQRGYRKLGYKQFGNKAKNRMIEIAFWIVLHYIIGDTH